MTENTSIIEKDSARQYFQQAYVTARKMMQRMDLDLNRKQIIVVADQGRKIYRPYRWDH
ncbi:hypothetical protein [Vibrio gangliei]|uniref:hypothetical protein n=1 Tax=Vibrio gangliei TaxID=2077090 RepID=UPI001300748F|nr:hypothetical protein [Vibrio gangliei]